MDIKKWLWKETGPTHEPRWLVYVCVVGLAVVVVYNVVLTP